MNYEIICTTRKENDVIDKLGYIVEGNSKDSASALENKEEINKKIQNGNFFFYTNKAGKKVEVIAVENDYVRTKPDDTPYNNLLHLRICRT